MTRRLWICDACGRGWSDETEGDEHRDDPDDPMAALCPGRTVAHVAAPVADAHPAWRCSECGEPFSGKWDGRENAVTCPCCTDGGRPQLALVIAAVAT